MHYPTPYSDFGHANTTADAAENIDILYTYVVDSIFSHNIVVCNHSASDDVARFQEFNILNMKIAGLEMATDINKGANMETAEYVIESYEKCRQDLFLDE